jgi:hypothetical protein
MKILDENDVEILESDVDLNCGKLKEEKLFKEHHDEIKEVKEQSHYEIIAEYPNGGKEVKKVIDVAYIPPQEAYTEYEDILRYVLFDENEKKEKLKDLQEQKKQEAKDKLELFFAENSLKGKFHNNKMGEYALSENGSSSNIITKMQGTYQAYKLREAAGQTAILQWNEPNGRCENWLESEFVQLMDEAEKYIHGYEDVKQDFLADITACKTIEELEAIKIEYKKNI